MPVEKISRINLRSMGNVGAEEIQWGSKSLALPPSGRSPSNTLRLTDKEVKFLSYIIQELFISRTLDPTGQFLISEA